MLAANIDKDDGYFNGAQGVIEKIDFKVENNV